MTNDKAKRRAAWFRAFCTEAAARSDAWITSIPKADTVTLETTPGSPWPAELRGNVIMDHAPLGLGSRLGEMHASGMNITPSGTQT
jgi:hypothetical protein